MLRQTAAAALVAGLVLGLLVGGLVGAAAGAATALYVPAWLGRSSPTPTPTPAAQGGVLVELPGVRVEIRP